VPAPRRWPPPALAKSSSPPRRPRRSGRPAPAHRCLDGAAGSYTTQQHKTHNSDILEVCYLWHPWYGQNVHVFQSVTKGGQTVLRCALDASHRMREVPLWMFDRAACCTMRLTQMPWVGVEDLRQLQRLLLRGVVTSPGVIQDQHPSSQAKGDADATNTPIENTVPVRSVYSPAEQADLGQLAGSRDSRRDSATRRDAARARRSTTTSRTPKGGRR
jgi:hypothetical protein